MSNDTAIQETEIPEAEENIVQGVHNYSSADAYVPVTDSLLKERLEWFQDQKLALMMHWGAYCQWGIVESWALSDQDADWSRHQIDWTTDNQEFRRQYFDLNKTFNPVKFNPEAWAKLAKESGFRYMIFTTKHHDGFCMWDTEYTDYKITGPDCPFHTHPKADVVKNLWEAFRYQGLGIAAYFSKADWHIPYYWNPNYDRGHFTWRGPSYKPEEDPEMWEKFVQFTHNQIMELATKYGRIDILWFDAGWVCEANGQDIRLGEIVDRVRKFQPWVLSSDRCVGGPYENYVTPEQCIPEEPLMIPWESCITLGTSFSYNYEDDYKTPRQVVGLLLNVVAKGGNLALNVGPRPDGGLPRGAVETLKGLGEWMKKNGEGIYETRVCAPYSKNDFFFTRNRKTGAVYAFRYYEEECAVETDMVIPYTGAVSAVSLIETGAAVPFTREADGIHVSLPAMEANPITVGFKIEE